MSDNQRKFDQEAPTWDENPTRLKLAADVARAMQTAIPLNNAMNALDFGCGTGLLTLQLAPKVARITGADTSSGMLDVLAKKIAAQGLGNVKTLRLDPNDGGGLSGQYDLIVSNMALHHIKEIPALLRNFHESLTPGGYLCLADLDPEQGQFHPDPTGVFHEGFERNAFRKMLEAAGFTHIQDTTAAEVTKPAADGQLRTFSIFLFAARRG